MIERYPLAFGAGFLCSASLHSLFQDFLGKQDYIKYLQEHWIEGWITIPMALFVLAWSVWTLMSLVFGKVKA